MNYLIVSAANNDSIEVSYGRYDCLYIDWYFVVFIQSAKIVFTSLNDELRNLKQMELDRKKSFIKDKFFSTQIYISRLINN